ncbi:protein DETOXIFICATION 53 [Impatiens glandulifera]|uniref:protein DETOXIFICATION 53 n=1 Tax=Impatiens glandulifera TaxID=253017 RepID=UPI001FB08CBB|nr:protein DETOXIFICATION 53 [Impatiens glandulifera]
MNESGEIEISSEQTVPKNDEESEQQWRRKEKQNYFFHFMSFPCFPLNQVIEELIKLGKIAFPILMTSLLIFSKSIISMLFLGRMGKVELAGGSLAIGFANITGFSVMKGLTGGMDPICYQAYGAKKLYILTQTYLKTFLLLLFASVPISLLWLNVEPVLLRLGQERLISKVAKDYLIFSLPELLAHSHLNPLRSFLRTQSINSPATIAATVATILHLPINYYFVVYLKLGVKGVAMGSVCYAYNMNLGLMIYVVMSKFALKPWTGATFVSTFQGWRPLLSLALPSVCSVCLEWWWYEIVLFLGGLLDNPEAAVGAMGILIQTTGTIYVVPYSLSVSISQRVGHELGAGEPARARLAAVTGVTLGVVYGFSAFGLFVALRSVWGKMYTDDPQILGLISLTLPILGLAEVGNAPQTTVCGVLMGSARPRVGVHVNLAAFYLIGLPVATLMAFSLKMGFSGLWWGLVAAQTACAFMMVWTLIQTDWRHQAKRAEELTLAAGETDTVTNLVP